MEQKKSNKKYIYNPEQAKFYIGRGCQVLDTGIHTKTNKIFWVFGYYETEEAYLEWLNRCICKKCH